MKSKRVNPPYIPFPNIISFSSYFFRNGIQVLIGIILLRMFRGCFWWTMKIRVKALQLSTRVKFVSEDWLLLDPPGISEAGSDLKIIQE